MKFHKLTLVASVFLTVVMSIIAMIFDYSNDVVFHEKNNFYLTLLLCVIFIFVLNYLILEYLFNYYGKKQIKKISTILPGDFLPEDENEMNFKELGERVSEFSQKNATEMDTMKEMET